MIVHRGGNSHFPLLAPRTSIEQQTAKVSQPLREDDNADERHNKMKDLQAKGLGELSNRLQECGGQDDINGFCHAMNWRADELCDRSVGKPAADHCHGEKEQWKLEFP